MPVGELLEIVREDGLGELHDPGLLLRPELEEKAFPKVSRAHTGRLELLYHFEHGRHLLGRGLYVRPESQVIDDAVNVPAEVPVTVQTADDEGGHVTVMLGEVAIAQLFHKALREALLDRECVVLGTLVLPVVVDPELVRRNRIILVDLVDGNVLWLVAVLILLGSGRVIKHRIVLQLGLHPLLQLLDRQLNKFDGLDLKRRKLLSLFEF
ncbi:unknown [Alistipes sp. CAG:514]|nr:unknown [Alistipes sp. CAG:514]